MIERKNRKIAIVVPTYQAIRWIDRCLESVKKISLPPEYEIVLIAVDNASTDGTQEYLKQQTWIKFLPQVKNLGFTGANNIGLRWADQWDADYVMLLNQDAYLTSESLTLLVDFLEKQNQEVIAVQPQILCHPRTDLVNSLGGCIHFLGFGFTSYYLKTSVEAGLVKEINYASGAACLYRLPWLKKLGFFDERLFLYHEDLDWGWVSKLWGGKTLLFTTPVVYHEYEFSRSITKYYYMERNRWLVLLQNYHWLTLVILIIPLFLSELSVFIKSFFNGWWKDKLKSYVYFLSVIHWRQLLARRKFVQAGRQCSDKVVTKYFYSSILHQTTDNWVIIFLINPITKWYWQLAHWIMFW